MDKKAKKVKFVPNEDDVRGPDEEQKKNEVTIAPPVSMVNVMLLVHCRKLCSFLLMLI